jgi:CDP-diacylglycerol--glycerol-3-phosphate 3-phosphatidyltransferase
LKKDIFYISNQISILRIILVIPLLFLLLNQNNTNTIIIASILVAMYITDLLDGYLARKLNQVSELGKIIDPLADKIAVVSIVIILYFQGRIESWFFIIVVARDLLIVIFGLYLKSKNKIVLMSNYPGKIAVFSIGIIILLTVFNTGNYELLQKVISYLYYISVILIIYSLFLYLKRFNKTMGD